MQLLLKRLEIVRAAMALEDESLLALQLPALQAALTQMDAATSAHAALAEIIRLLQGRHYPEAVARIGAFLTAQTALVGYLDEQQTALRFELAGLEREITTQTLERDEMLEKMERFNRAFLAQCGAPLQEIFRLREAIARLELEKLRRAAEEDEALYQALAEAQAARQAFEEDKQQSEAAQAAEPPAAELDADEEARLKKAYRRASQLCHPDRVAAEFQVQAEALFKSLGQAYKRKDVAEVERILAQLQRGVFTAASEALTDRDALQARIAELRASIDAINAEIAALAEDETWELLQGFADEAALQEYLEEQRELLLAELAVLQERWQALQG
jgi:putative uncharacterized protein (fragment)